MQAPDRRSGKEGNNECYQEAHAADQRFHDGPGLEGGLFVHTHKALHQPEAGVVEVGADGGAACNGSGDTGKVQRAQRAEAVVIATVAEPTEIRTRAATMKATSTSGRLAFATALPMTSPRPEFCSI